MGCTLNCDPSSLSVFSLRIASIATRALNFGMECFLVVIDLLVRQRLCRKFSLLPGLKSWGHYRGNYFRPGNADLEFDKMDYFVVKSLRLWRFRRGGQRAMKREPFTGDQFFGMDLHKLIGAAKYPAQAASRRPSVSRVRENRTHGLKRGF